MGAFTGMTELLGDLVPVATSLGYPESSICVLKGDIDLLAAKFPQTHANLMSCRHNRDSRTPIEYGQDLVASWIYEDTLMAELNYCGLEIVGAGADRNREILANARVSAASDCCVSSGGSSRKLEIMNDYGGFWSNVGKLNLRDDKFNKLAKEKSIFLGVAPQDKKYIIIDFANLVQSQLIPRHRPFGGKPAQEISITQDQLIDLDFNAIAKEIIDML